MNRSNGMRWRYFLLMFTYVILQTSFPEDDNNVFSPTRLTGNVIALRPVARGFFCRLNHSDLMLRCDIPNITTDARLQVVEPVMRRTISVNFRFEDAMIYDVEPIALVTHTSENRLVDTPHIARVALSESYTNTRSWDNSVSLTVGVETTFRSGIPLVAQAGITVSTEINDTFTFGQSHEVTNEASAEVEVTVPPMSKVKASLMALKGRCNVPFSYVQTDVYYDGRTVSHTLHDGVYNGVNYYSFYSRVEPAVRIQLPPPPSSSD